MKLSNQPTEGLCIDFPATLEAAREAVCEIIGWLELHHHERDECVTWELVLIEAVTNAVTHSSSQQTLQIEAGCSAKRTQIRITDHSEGFEWPKEVCLPKDDENEHGRGLFIIQSLTDHCCYLQGREKSVLELQRQRKSTPPPAEDLEITLDLMTAEVSSCYETLANIFRLCAEAARDVSSEELASNWLRQLLEISGADFLALRMLTPDGRQLEAIATVHGGGFSIPFIDLNRADLIESRAFALRQDQWFDGSSVFHQDDPLSRRSSAISGVAHPLEIGGEVIGVLTVGVFCDHWEPKARDINVVRSLGDFLGTLLHSLRRRDEANHSRLIKRELQIAADIQRSLLPAELPHSATLQCAGHLTTAGEVGGDFMDGITLADGARLFVIADVMGKGVPAALFATAFRSLLHSHLDLAAQPCELMQRLNTSLFAELDRAEMFITVELAWISADGFMLRTCNAGHGPLLLTDGRQVTEIGADGPPLGITGDEPYTHQEVSLQGITHLLLHTDGLSDSTLPEDSGLGRDRLHQWLINTSVEGIDAWSSRDTLRQMHHDHLDNARAQDDATFLVLARESALLSSPRSQTLTHARR
jgi:serine phosphatase RsbU (regulator of sigma subunit)/anti-sigma regulatory factor (Ser/Thr protein kinase)